MLANQPPLILACLHVKVIAIAHSFVCRNLQSGQHEVQGLCMCACKAHSLNWLHAPLQAPGNVHSISRQPGVANAKKEFAAGGGSP